jgi:hypothetical protein
MPVPPTKIVRYLVVLYKMSVILHLIMPPLPALPTLGITTQFGSIYISSSLPKMAQASIFLDIYE